MTGRAFRQLAFMAGPLVAALAWLRYEVAHPVSTAWVSSGGVRALTLTPGRFYWAYSAFVVAAAMVPLLYLVDIVALPPRPRRATRAIRVVLALTVLLPCAVAGYVWESLRTSITLTPSSVHYTRSGEHVSVLWSDVRGMRLRMRGDRELLDLSGPGRTVSVDIGPYVPYDRLTVIRQATSLADLTLVRRSPDEWVWRRAPMLWAPNSPGHPGRGGSPVPAPTE